MTSVLRRGRLGGITRARLGSQAGGKRDGNGGTDGTHVARVVRRLVRLSAAQLLRAQNHLFRGHQRSSEVIRGHQRSSEVIRGHQHDHPNALKRDRTSTSRRVARANFPVRSAQSSLDARSRRVRIVAWTEGALANGDSNTSDAQRAHSLMRTRHIAIHSPPSSAGAVPSARLASDEARAARRQGAVPAH